MYNWKFVAQLKWPWGHWRVCYSLPILVDMWSHHTCLYFQKCRWIENQVRSVHQTHNRPRHRVLWLNQKPNISIDININFNININISFLFKSLWCDPFVKFVSSISDSEPLSDLGAEAWESFSCYSQSAAGNRWRELIKEYTQRA